MKLPSKPIGKILDESLGKFSDVSSSDMESARTKALAFLESDPAGSEKEIDRNSVATPVRHSRWLAVATIAAAITVAVLVPARALRSAPAVLEETAGSRTVRFGEVVRGGTLRFPDGSRVAVRPQSEVRLQDADDGVRLSLQKGHVLVLSGEARVQQGSTNRTLRAGEQVQAPIDQAPSPSAPSSTAGESFDVASIRQCDPSRQAAPQVPGGRSGGNACRANPCLVWRDQIRIDPRRFSVSRATLHGLVAAAYNVSCTLPGVISGEPQWASSEFFDIEAIMPEGSPSYTPADVVEGKAVALQKMLRNLLADRFKLKVQRQTRDMAAYNLVVSKPGTWDCRLPVSCHGIRLSEDQAPNGIQADREGLTTIPTTLNLHTTIALGQESWLSIPAVPSSIKQD